MTYICVSNLTVIGSDNGLSPGLHQAIIWTNNVILWIRSLGTNFSEILIEFLTFWFKKMRLNVSSVKWRPFCLGLNVLRAQLIEYMPEFPVWCNYLSMTKTPAYDNAIICRCTLVYSVVLIWQSKDQLLIHNQDTCLWSVASYAGALKFIKWF